MAGRGVGRFNFKLSPTIPRLLTSRAFYPLPHGVVVVRAGLRNSNPIGGGGNENVARRFDDTGQVSAV